MSRKKAYPTGFDGFWKSLNDEGRSKFAGRVGSTVGYLGSHVLYGRKLPRIETIENMADACNEAGFYTSPEELLVWLYRRRRARLAATPRKSLAA